MPLLIEYYVVLLLYDISKIFSIKKCPVRTLNFPVKSRFIRYMSDLRCTREFENVGTFIVLRRKTGLITKPELMDEVKAEFAENKKKFK